MFIFKLAYREKEMPQQEQQKMEDPFKKTEGKMYEAPKDLKALTPAQIQKNLDNSIEKDKNQVNYYNSAKFEVNGYQIGAGIMLGAIALGMATMTGVGVLLPAVTAGVGAVFFGIGLLQKPVGNLLTGVTSWFHQSTENGCKEHAALIMASSIAGSKEQREEYASIFQDYLNGKIKTKESLYAQIGSVYMGSDYSASAESKVMQAWVSTGTTLMKDAETSLGKCSIKVTPSKDSEVTMEVSKKTANGMRISTVQFVPPEYVDNLNELIYGIFGVKPLTSDKPQQGEVNSGWAKFIPSFTVK